MCITPEIKMLYISAQRSSEFCTRGHGTGPDAYLCHYDRHFYSAGKRKRNNGNPPGIAIQTCICYPIQGHTLSRPVAAQYHQHIAPERPMPLTFRSRHRLLLFAESTLFIITCLSLGIFISIRTATP